MSLITTDSSNYSNISDAVRYKLGSTDTYTPEELAAAIMTINTTPGVMGVKGAAETEFRQGEVSLSSADIGALPADGTAVKATADADGNTISTTYEKVANVTSKGSADTPVYFDSNGVAVAITSYSGKAATAGSADQATKDGDGNSISDTYEKKSQVQSVGSSTKPVYFDENGDAKTISSYEGNAATADSATNDSEGNKISTTYEPKANVTSKGTTTKPIYFDSDGIARPIDSYEGNAASATKAEQDINGDVINTTYVKKASLKEKGSDTVPIYFDVNGAAKEISSYSGNAATATKATQDSDGNAINTTYLKAANVKSKGSADTPVYFDENGVAAPITTYNGNAATANKFKNAVDITMGDATKSFDGSSNISFTTEEMGIVKPSVKDGVLTL